MMLNKRQHDLKLFIEACLLVKEGKHTKIDGLNKITELSSKLSSKLTLEDKQKLPGSNTKLNATRLVGFIDAEGSFYFSVN
jgi:hypothetical protein